MEHFFPHVIPRIALFEQCAASILAVDTLLSGSIRIVTRIYRIRHPHFCPCLAGKTGHILHNASHAEVGEVELHLLTQSLGRTEQSERHRLIDDSTSYAALEIGFAERLSVDKVKAVEFPERRVGKRYRCRITTEAVHRRDNRLAATVMNDGSNQLCRFQGQNTLFHQRIAQSAETHAPAVVLSH